MKSSLDKLNLRPFERRLVVVVGAIMFVVLNLWFVVPHFSDWGRVQFRMAKARRTLAAFNGEVRQIPVYQSRIRELGSENSTIPMEEQAQHFNTVREKVAAEAGITIGNSSRISTRTNQFFLELTQTITLLCEEEQLVNFLYNLGAGNSLIRVRDLGLKPDAPRQRLNASVKLVASYQKKAPPRTAAPVGATKGPAPGATQPGSSKAAPPSSSKPASATPVKATPTSKKT